MNFIKVGVVAAMNSIMSILSMVKKAGVPKMKLMNACKIFIKIGKRISFALYSPYMVLV